MTLHVEMGQLKRESKSDPRLNRRFASWILMKRTAHSCFPGRVTIQRRITRRFLFPLLEVIPHNLH